MAENITINGTTYNGVTGIAVKTADGRTVLFEVSPVKTVNGIAPDANGNINVTLPEADMDLIANKVVEIMGGQPFVGRFASPTEIVVTSSLPDGVYTVKLETEDGLHDLGTLTKTSIKEYTIKWCNYNGTVLETDTVTEGDTPVYNGSTPTRAEDDQYTYTFKGWDKTVVAATADATYTATYTQTAKSNYTNLAVPTSTEWKTDVRYDSNNAEKPIAGEKLVITNLIQWTKSNSTEIHIKGLDILGAVSNGNKYGRLYKYNSSKTLLGGFNAGSATGVWKKADYDSSVTILYNLQNTLGSTCEYISLGGILTGDADDVIITFNEPIQ